MNFFLKKQLQVVAEQTKELDKYSSFLTGVSIGVGEFSRMGTLLRNVVHRLGDISQVVKQSIRSIVLYEVGGEYYDYTHLEEMKWGEEQTATCEGDALQICMKGDDE